MIKNLHSLLYLAPIKNMEKSKVNAYGMTYGLGEAGYDIRLAQEVIFEPPKHKWVQDHLVLSKGRTQVAGAIKEGKFALASAMEEFQMPPTLVGIVHDKSSWARQGLSVFNTVIEPGWHGFLTLELVFHGDEFLHIPAGSPIAQVIFHQVQNVASYNGKYQNQENKPTPVIHERPV